MLYIQMRCAANNMNVLFTDFARPTMKADVSYAVRV